MSLIPITPATAALAFDVAQSVVETVQSGVESGSRFAQLLAGTGADIDTKRDDEADGKLATSIQDALQQLQKVLKERLQEAGVDLDFKVSLAGGGGDGLRVDNLHFGEEKIRAALKSDDRIAEQFRQLESLLKRRVNSPGQLVVHLHRDKFDVELE